MPTGLPQIQEGQISREVLQQTCNTFSVGPLHLELCFDSSERTLTVTVRLLGVALGRAVLRPSNRAVTIGGSIDGFRAQVTITVDFDREVLTVSGELCAPRVGCTDLGPIEVPLVRVAFSPVALAESPGPARPSISSPFDIDTIRKLDPYVRFSAEGWTIEAPPEVLDTIPLRELDEIQRQIADANRLIRQAVLVMDPDGAATEAGEGRVVILRSGGRNGVRWHWWGVEIYLNAQNSNRLQGAIWAGAGTAALTGLIAAETGVGGLAGGVIAAILTIGAGAIQFCTNSRGVVLVRPYVGPPFCHGQ